MEDLVSELGYKVGALPSSYLGLPLGAHHNMIAMWDGWRADFVRVWLCGKDGTSPKGVGSLSFRVHCLACLSISCLYFGCLG